MSLPWLPSGKGDGDEHHQPHQRPPGRHGGGPAAARGPEEEGDAAQGPAGRHLDARPGQTHQHQPGSTAPLYPGEDLKKKNGTLRQTPNMLDSCSPTAYLCFIVNRPFKR